MIAYISGSVLEKTPKSVIVLAGALGYEVFLTPRDLEKSQLGSSQQFFIYSNIKEDAFDLYGFNTLEELEFFKKVVSISGIGPKTALNVLALSPVQELKKAIGQGDVSFIQQVSGIGKKTAERLVLELKEKFINELSGTNLELSGGDKQVIAALISLGYREKEAAEAVKQIGASEGDLSQRVKEALKHM